MVRILHSPHGRGAIALAVGLVLVGVCGRAAASDWQQSFSVPLGVDIDSNPLLVSGDVKSIWRVHLRPVYNVSRNFGVDDFSGMFRFNAERSTDVLLSDDRNDPSLELGWQRATALGGYGLNASYERGSTRYSELEETGTVVANGTRSTHKASGNWNRALGVRSKLELDGTFRLEEYDGVLEDFSTVNATGTYTYSFSERIEPLLYSNFTRYDPKQDPVGASNNSSLQAGVKWKASEFFELTAKLGESYTSGPESDHSLVGSSRLDYRAGSDDAYLEIGRLVLAASSQGGLYNVDEIKGAFNRSIDERSRLGFELLWRDSKGQRPNVYQRLRASLTHDFSRHVSVMFDFQFKRREEPGLPSASGRVLGITVTYAGPNL